MSLPPLASVDDLATWPGVTIGDNQIDQAEALLDAASTLVRTFTGRLWIGEDDLPEAGVTAIKLAAVRSVVVIAAARVWNNPTMTTQQSAGPYSRSVNEWAAMGLILTDEEKEMIGGATGGGVTGLGSVRVVVPAAAAGVPRSSWLYDEDPDDQLSESDTGS